MKTVLRLASWIRRWHSITPKTACQLAGDRKATNQWQDNTYSNQSYVFKHNGVNSEHLGSEYWDTECSKKWEHVMRKINKKR